MYIQKGAKFIATNDDHYDIVNNYKMPGGGTIVKCIQTGCGVEPIILGKPNAFVIDLIC